MSKLRALIRGARRLLGLGESKADAALRAELGEFARSLWPRWGEPGGPAPEAAPPAALPSFEDLLEMAASSHCDQIGFECRAGSVLATYQRVFETRPEGYQWSAEASDAILAGMLGRFESAMAPLFVPSERASVDASIGLDVAGERIKIFASAKLGRDPGGSRSLLVNFVALRHARGPPASFAPVDGEAWFNRRLAEREAELLAAELRGQTSQPKAASAKARL